MEPAIYGGISNQKNTYHNSVKKDRSPINLHLHSVHRGCFSCYAVIMKNKSGLTHFLGKYFFVLGDWDDLSNQSSCTSNEQNDLTPLTPGLQFIFFLLFFLLLEFSAIGMKYLCTTNFFYSFLCIKTRWYNIQFHIPVACLVLFITLLWDWDFHVIIYGKHDHGPKWVTCFCSATNPAH